jgi:type I restriction enzyme S subunit
MKQKAKHTLIPKLRFPEFRDMAEWEEVPLERVAERLTTKNLDGSVARVLTNSAEHGVLDQRDYFEKDIANAGNIDGYYIVDLGDFVYNPRISTLAPVGPISRNNIGKGVMSPLYTVFRFTDENTDFYQCYFKSASWHSYLRRVSSMGARHDRMSITTGDFMVMPVPIPPVKEQQKIADCLDSLDGLIAAAGRKLEALKAHKKGLMQQIFPQPGQTQPRLRFPEFRDKPGWEEFKLGKLVDTSNGKSPSQYLLSSDGMYPFVKVEDLNNCTKYQVNSRAYCDDPGGVVPKGSILFPKRGAAIELNKIRITAVEILIDTNLMAITPSDSATTEFLFYYLDHVGLSQIADTSTIPQINNKHIIPFIISAPLRSEQQLIADCLTTLDDLIAAQAAKIDALKQHKRGLMQQLFPAPEDS